MDMFPNTITLFHHAKNGGYERLTLIKNCFCYKDTKARIDRQGKKTLYKLTVIIDNPSLIEIEEGLDVVVEGTCDFNFDNSSEEMISKSLRNLKSKFKPYTVSEVVDNSYGGIPNLVLYCN